MVTNPTQSCRCSWPSTSQPGRPTHTHTNRHHTCYTIHTERDMNDRQGSAGSSGDTARQPARAYLSNPSTGFLSLKLCALAGLVHLRQFLVQRAHLSHSTASTQARIGDTVHRDKGVHGEAHGGQPSTSHYLRRTGRQTCLLLLQQVMLEPMPQRQPHGHTLLILRQNMPTPRRCSSATSTTRNHTTQTTQVTHNANYGTHHGNVHLCCATRRSCLRFDSGDSRGNALLLLPCCLS